jgi:hypothetical protein
MCTMTLYEEIKKSRIQCIDFAHIEQKQNGIGESTLAPETATVHPAVPQIYPIIKPTDIRFVTDSVFTCQNTKHDPRSASYFQMVIGIYVSAR